MKRFVLSGFALCTALLTSQNLSAQDVTVSNNLLYDAALTPNLRVGVRLSPHWSLGMTAGYRPWPTDDASQRKWRHVLLSPDVRYWADSVNVHHFFGFNVLYSHYNVADVKFPFGLWRGVRDERRQGDLAAAGAYYGYSWPLGRHWNVEALVGAAVGYTRYDRYECGLCGTQVGDDSKLFVMPQAALNIVWNIPGRPRRAVVREPEPEAVVAHPQPQVVEPQPATSHVQEKPVVEPPRPTRADSIRELMRENPVLAYYADYQPYDRQRVLRKDSSLFLYFPVAQYQVREDFRDNRATLERILSISRRIAAEGFCEVKKIQVVGFASVDGGLWGNERLAQRRAESLKNYVQRHLALPDSLFDVGNGGEAWADLRDYLADLVASAPAKATAGQPSQEQLRQALAVIDGERDLTRREQRLRQLHGGSTWRYIRQVFGDHRNAGYVRIFIDPLPE